MREDMLMDVTVIDIGGTHVEILANRHRHFDSGPTLTPGEIVFEVRKFLSNWKSDVVFVGYPGPGSEGDPFRSAFGP